MILKRNNFHLIPKGEKRNRLFSNPLNRQNIEELTAISKKLFEKYDQSTAINNKTYSSFHTVNDQFHRHYQQFSSISNQQKYLEKTFIDLIIQYKTRGYIIPDLTTKHNLFSPSVLLFGNSEIEEFYKVKLRQKKNPKEKDESKAYLYKIGRIVDSLKFNRSIRKPFESKQCEMETLHTNNDNDSEDYHSMTEREKKGTHNCNNNYNKDILKEKQKLILDINAANKSINDNEKKLRVTSIISQKAVIPKLKLKKNNEDSAIKTVKTINSFHSTNYTSRDYQSRRSDLSTACRFSSLKEQKGFIQVNSKCKTNLKNKASRNTINRWLSHPLNVNTAIDNDYNKTSTANLNLVTQRDYLNFFFTLKPSDVANYDFKKIAEDYCNQFLSKAQQKEIEIVYKK